MKYRPVIPLLAVLIAGCENRGADDRVPVDQYQRAEMHGPGYSLVAMRTTDPARLSGNVVLLTNGYEPVFTTDQAWYDVPSYEPQARVDTSKQLLRQVERIDDQLTHLQEPHQLHGEEALDCSAAAVTAPTLSVPPTAAVAAPSTPSRPRAVVPAAPARVTTPAPTHASRLSSPAVAPQNPALVRPAYLSYPGHASTTWEHGPTTNISPGSPSRSETAANDAEWVRASQTRGTTTASARPIAPPPPDPPHGVKAPPHATGDDLLPLSTPGAKSP